MYVTTPKLKNGKTSVRVAHSYRNQKGQPRSRIIQTLGQSDDPKQIEEWKKLARNFVDAFKKGLIQLDHSEDSKIKQTIDTSKYSAWQSINKGYEDIFGKSYDDLGFSSMLQSGRNNTALNQVMKYVVLTRIFEPSSKLRSCTIIEQKLYKNLTYKRILGMMDHVAKSEENLKKQLFQSMSQGRKKFDILLFDVTTLYFESIQQDDLRDFGYSKDGKFGEVQVVLAVLSDQDGRPLSYEIFQGNTAEIKTFSKVISSFATSFNVEKMSVTADRGMFSDKNFSFLENLAEKLNIEIEYVVSAPLKKLSQRAKQEILEFKKREQEKTLSDLTDAALSEEMPEPNIYEFNDKGRRILVCYCENRRRRDQKKRDKLLAKLEDMACKEGKVSVAKLRKNTGVHRYLKFDKKAKDKEAEIDQDKIASDKEWDGLYGICSNKDWPAKKILQAYRRLWKIEELFRINKHTLRMRPIFHWTDNRIRAHIFICFLAYSTLRHVEILMQHSGQFFSPQRLIDILGEVEVFILKHKIKGPSSSFCFPKDLSKEAQMIYTALRVKYPKTSYKINASNIVSV